MPSIGPMFADSARLSLGYAERMLVGVTADRFARFAQIGGQVIESNHPAFIYGHLSLYPCRIVEQLGGDASSIKPTQLYLEKFSHTAKCMDDPDGSSYPAMEEIVERMLTAHRAAEVSLRAADDALFLTENANEAMRGKFATTGSMHGFYMGGHVMMHIGQVSAWRRMMGLGAA